MRIKQVNGHKGYRIVLAPRKCLINNSYCHFTAMMLVVLCHYLSNSKYVDIEIRGQVTEKLFLCIPMWVSVCVCLHASLCVCFFVSVTMTVYAGQRSILDVVSQRLFILLFETESLLDLSSLTHLDRVAYKHQDSICFSLPNSGTTSMSQHTSHFSVATGDQAPVLMLVRQAVSWVRYLPN